MAAAAVAAAAAAPVAVAQAAAASAAWASTIVRYITVLTVVIAKTVPLPCIIITLRTDIIAALKT